jgi:hypothetical protein
LFRLVGPAVSVKKMGPHELNECFWVSRCRLGETVDFRLVVFPKKIGNWIYLGCHH